MLVKFERRFFGNRYATISTFNHLHDVDIIMQFDMEIEPNVSQTATALAYVKALISSPSNALERRTISNCSANSWLGHMSGDALAQQKRALYDNLLFLGRTGVEVGTGKGCKLDEGTG